MGLLGSRSGSDHRDGVADRRGPCFARSGLAGLVVSECRGFTLAAFTRRGTVARVAELPAEDHNRRVGIAERRRVHLEAFALESIEVECPHALPIVVCDRIAVDERPELAGDVELALGCGPAVV